MAKVRIERRDRPTTDFLLGSGTVRIGRGVDNQIHFRDPWLSREHAVIRSRAGVHSIEDAGSRNGTFVNGKRLASPHPLSDGDVVSLGDVRLTFVDVTRSQALRVAESEVSLAGKNTVLISSEELSLDTYRESVREAASPDPESPDSFLPALNEAASALIQHFPIDQLVERVIQLVLDAVPAERGALLLRSRDPKGERTDSELSVRARRGYGEEEEVRISRTIVRAVLDDRQAVLTLDAQSDERFDGAVSLMMEGIRSVLCAPLVNTDREVIGLLYLDDRIASASFSETSLRLVGLLASLAAVKIENSQLLEDQIEKRRMEEQLAVGTQIQQALLPSSAPAIEGYDVRGAYRSCFEVGGDYFDYVPKEDGKWAIVVADISGKGVGAALLMAVLQASIRALVQTVEEPADLVVRLNKVLIESSPSNKFATVFYSELDPATHRLRYVSGGHNPSLLWTDGEVRELNSTGPIVGLVQAAQFRCEELTLPPGSTLLLYTDGVTELMNAEGEEFGTDRLAEILASTPDRPADLLTAVQKALLDFGGNEAFDDDSTMVVLRRER